jgi:GAF domain-containing protein
MKIEKIKKNIPANFERIAVLINSSLELKEILPKTCRAAVETFGVDHSGLVLFTEPPDQGRVEAEYPDWKLVGKTIKVKGELVEEKLIKSKKPVMFVDVANQETLGSIKSILTKSGIKSILLVPVVSKGKVLGSFSLDVSTGTRKFTRQEIKFCELFADQVAIAIDKARLFEQIEKSLRMVSAFYETTSKLNLTDDPNQGLKFIAENVQETIGALSISITALDSSDRPYEKAHVGYDKEKRVVRPHGLSSEVMKSGKPYIIADVDKNPELVNPGMLKSGVKTAICLPLQSQGATLGVMWVTYGQLHPFDETEKKLLGLLANHAGAYIRSAHLFQERNLLLDTSKMASSAQDLDQCLRSLAEMMVKSLAATFCRISLLDETGTTLTTRAAYTIVDNIHWDPKIGQQYSLKESLDEAQAINTCQPQVLEQAKSSDLLRIMKERTHFNGELKAAVLIPLAIGKKVFGVVTLGERRNWERGSFTLERVGLYQSMADQVAALIARMRLQEQAEKDSANFHRLSEASSKISSNLDPEQTLHFVVQKAAEAVEGWRASAVLFDENKRPHRLASVGFNHEIKSAVSIRRNGVSMEVIRTGEPIMIEDVNTRLDLVNPEMVEDGVQAAICLPLQLGEENIGVLWIHYKEPRHFHPSQIEALQLYSIQAAIAYDNARRMKELKQLHSAIEAMSSVAEPKDVLQQIAKSVKEILEADYTVIWSYDNIRGVFIPEELVAENVPADWIKIFRENEPVTGMTTRKILEQGYIEVDNLADTKYEFIGSQTRSFLNGLQVRSFQGIRLDVNDEPMGVLYVDYKTRRNLGPNEHRMLDYLAHQAALALHRARLLDQVNRARNAAAVVAQIIAMEKDEKSTWDSIVEGAKDALHCDAVVLYQYNDDNHRLGYPPSMTGVHHPDQVIKLPSVDQQSIIWTTIRSDELIIIDDAVSNEFTRERRFTQEEGIRSLVAIPLKAGKKNVGAMFINYRNKHRFVDDELTSIKLFANQAAVAIRNAQLLGEVRKRVSALEALHEAGKIISSSFTLDKTLDDITAQALHIVGVENELGMCFSHIALLEGNKLVFVAASPRTFFETLQKHKIDFKTSPKIGIVGRVAKTGKSQYVSDISNDQDFIQTSKFTSSQLSVPLKMGEQVIGVLTIEHTGIDAFTKEDMRNVELLAAQAAITIQNAKRYQELGDTKTALAAQEALTWMGMASSTWRHAISTHAITIYEQVQLLRDDLAGTPLSDTITKRLLMIEKKANEIQQKPITPPLGGEENVQSLSINELLRERTKRLWEEEPYKNVTLRLDLRLEEDATVRSSSEWLQRALDILIDNSVEATLGLEVRRITLTTLRNDSWAEIHIIDNGHGIPDETLNRLFIEPIKKPQGAKGLGMGLLMAKNIVQVYGGRLKCGETGPRGTTMVILLPLE